MHELERALERHQRAIAALEREQDAQREKLLEIEDASHLKSWVDGNARAIVETLAESCPPEDRWHLENAESNLRFASSETDERLGEQAARARTEIARIDRRIDEAHDAWSRKCRALEARGEKRSDADWKW
ncbi:hypothetical protein B5F40_14880 [Gordonibacter sp. An230]|uniref:hypothetical protein n=1 Tax=Gordonibacter sp. An230 TaxID=1965592 RepID=UPI000B3662AE|nr:hypothetical protein [Gordonibacter sp. An230]OUO86552.1 hypothetical protein B5F40_14880 [Gordonibacter sp. An230]